VALDEDIVAGEAFGLSFVFTKWQGPEVTVGWEIVLEE